MTTARHRAWTQCHAAAARRHVCRSPSLPSVARRRRLGDGLGPHERYDAPNHLRERFLLTSDDRSAFIRANTRLLPVPYAPAIRLHLADEATALWEKTEEELGELGLPPPFWAFAWAGGQALARFVLDEPEIVRGRRVLDFATGSGLVAIAAAMAGAARVEASDIDAFACAAVALNASANGVSVDVHAGDLIGRDDGWEVILAADISYERDLAARVYAWLTILERRGATVLIGDPGRTYLPKDSLETLATYTVPVTRSLEDSEIKRSSVWRFRRGSDGARYSSGSVVNISG